MRPSPQALAYGVVGQGSVAPVLGMGQRRERISAGQDFRRRPIRDVAATGLHIEHYQHFARGVIERPRRP